MMRLVLFLPLPDPLDESVAPDIVSRLSLELEQPLFHDRLRRDPRVIGARLPQRVVAHHAMPPREEVLHDVVHRMAHVEGAGHVGKRHHDDVPRIARVGVARNASPSSQRR